MAEENKSRERLRRVQPEDEARRIDELIREAEQAVINTKRFLEGLQETNDVALRQVGEIRERFEKDLRGLRRRQEQEEQV